MFKKTALVAALLLAAPAIAAPLKLEPADPQPSALSPGLAVSYAQASVRSLSEAARVADSARPGKPLEGLDYWDTEEGMETLTSGQAEKIVAVIEGYVRFDAPGTYTIDFLSNDGLRMSIGGQEVVKFDGVHPCEASKAVEAEVPVAGWYALEGLYFQRKGSACLHMRAGMGEPDWMPNAAFGH
ncbi:MAG: PA14 domain-containing protein [Pseudomonadota bacterium]